MTVIHAYIHFFTQLRNLINTIMSKNILLKTSLTALGCIVINADLIIKGGKRKRANCRKEGMGGG